MKILDRLPIDERVSAVSVPEGIARVKPYQILVWVSLAIKGVAELDPGAPHIPAVLDTGNNHNFAIREEHFAWARLPDASKIGQVRTLGQELDLLAVNVWIHPNRPGSRDTWDRQPFRLELHGGIAVYPRGVPSPARLPILGLRAIIKNDLRLLIDGKRREVSLKTKWF